MTGLIPLALNTNGASKSIAPSESNPPMLKRRTAMSSRSKSRSPRRSPQQKPASLLDMPFTSGEWKKALGDIKRNFQSGKYRMCMSRCDEILEHIKNPGCIEATYLIYLHFYAASALEMQVRSLQHNSPVRIELLNLAQTHYQTALDLAITKDESISQSSPQFQSPSFSDPPTPGNSDSSESSSPHTRSSSPSPTFRMVQCNVKPLQPTPKRKKQVAFRDMPIIEPAIRPDSPTLGFDEGSEISSPSHIVPGPLLLTGDKESTSICMPRTPTPELDHDESEDEPADSSIRARSLYRYCTILTGLKSQIVCHLTFINVELAIAQKPQQQPPSNEKMRSLDLQARIERLRANGWTRPRFDAQKYENLRENALSDLME